MEKNDSIEIQNVKSRTVSDSEIISIVFFPPPLKRMVVALENMVRIFDLNSGLSLIKTIYIENVRRICLLGEKDYIILKNNGVRIYNIITHEDEKWTEFAQGFSNWKGIINLKDRIVVGYSDLSGFSRSINVFDFRSGNTILETKLPIDHCFPSHPPNIQKSEKYENLIVVCNSKRYWKQKCTILRTFDWKSGQFLDDFYFGNSDEIFTYSTFVETTTGKEILVVISHYYYSGKYYSKISLFEIRSDKESSSGGSVLPFRTTIFKSGRDVYECDIKFFGFSKYFLLGDDSGHIHVFEKERIIINNDEEEGSFENNNKKNEVVSSETKSSFFEEWLSSTNSFQFCKKCTKRVHMGSVTGIIVVHDRSDGNQIDVITSGEEGTIRFSTIRNLNIFTRKRKENTLDVKERTDFCINFCLESSSHVEIFQISFFVLTGERMDVVCWKSLLC